MLFIIICLGYFCVAYCFFIKPAGCLHIVFIIDNQTLLDKWLLNALVQLPYSNGGVATLKTYIFIIIHFSSRTTLKITWLYMASRLDFYSFSGYYFLMATSVTLKSLSQLTRNDLLALFYGQHIMTVRIWCSTWGKKHILLHILLTPKVSEKNLCVNVVS